MPPSDQPSPTLAGGVDAASVSGSNSGAETLSGGQGASSVAGGADSAAGAQGTVSGGGQPEPQPLPTARLSLFEKIEIEGHRCLTAAEHAAAWLVGTVARGADSLHTLEADSPLVKMAIDSGIASANAHGVPVDAIESIGAEVLTLAQELAASLSSPPPTPAS